VEPVLTIRQPWASSIFVVGKDVENRKQRTNFRGRLWIHAGLYSSRREPDRWADNAGVRVPREPLARGLILGCVELYDCVEESDSVWAIDDHFYWLLRKPMALRRPVPHVGSLGFYWRRPPQGQLVRTRRSRASVV
jgi:hypothetical protein